MNPLPIDPGFRLHDLADDDDRRGEPPEQSERPEKKARRRTGTAKQREIALAAIDHPAEKLRALGEMLRDQLRTRPYVTLGVAIGLGFALGGGLSTRIGRYVLATAGRYAMREILKKRV